jgi:RNA polymerase primary sigma factor
MQDSDFKPLFSSLIRQSALYPILAADEERQLAIDGKAGDMSASERVILCNIRIVVSIAHSYTGLGLMLEDLVSEGSIGLLKAAAKFDPTYGVRFATYATFWVRHSILRALNNQARIIRLPAHVVARVVKIRQVLERMTAQLEREPNQEELAAETGLGGAQIRDVLEASAIPFSLQARESEEQGALEDVIADELAVDPSFQQEKFDQLQELNRLLQSHLLLNDRERTILSSRFGIGCKEQRSFELIGVRLGITGERVRQLHNQGLAKLRRKLKEENCNLEVLTDYLG